MELCCFHQTTFCYAGVSLGSFSLADTCLTMGKPKEGFPAALAALQLSSLVSAAESFVWVRRSVWCWCQYRFLEVRAQRHTQGWDRTHCIALGCGYRKHSAIQKPIWCPELGVSRGGGSSSVALELQDELLFLWGTANGRSGSVCIPWSTGQLMEVPWCFT